MNFLVISFLVCFAASKSFKDLRPKEEPAAAANTVLVPNSCLNQEDGSNVVVKPLDDDLFPALNVQCSNEYMIVDLNNDPDWYAYLSSYRKYHYNVVGPVKDDHSNWQEWLIPTMDNFLVSPDCKSCDADFELNEYYQTDSAYYMTPVMQGCTQLPIGRIGCDQDWYTYSCRVCEMPQLREPGYWDSYEVYNGLNDPDTTLHVTNEIDLETWAKYGLCGFTIRDAKATHSDETDTFQHCKSVTTEDVDGEVIMPRRKPSLGQDGRFCMCVQPSEFSQFEITEQELQEKQATASRASGVEVEAHAKSEALKEQLKVVQLWQSDFEKGTFRITRPGKYVVMEDITFDFKAPAGYENGDLETYNGEADWWPTASESERYPGAGDLKDPYFLGFWAGITIECDNVILEMNHHTLKMSEAFFYQQSFFAIISLTSQVFLPGQGPGFFGADPASASNVMIRNGMLGLSSHHGIQGNFNKNVLIENVRIFDFKTHGIQLNGFDGVTMRNVDVGPNRKLDKLTPWYAHMKALLPAYRVMLAEEEQVRDTCVHFRSPRYADDECVTMAQLMADVQTLLDMAFEYVLFDKTEYDSMDPDDYADDEVMLRKLRIWGEGRKIMINDRHSTQTATLYGIFLNYIGSNVIGWYAGSQSTHAHNVLLEHVKVHDLHHETWENIAFSQGMETEAQRVINCLNAPFNAYHIFGEETVHQLSYCNNNYDDNGLTKRCKRFRAKPLGYIGNIVSDIQLLSYELINMHDLSWNYCSAGASDLGALVNFAIRGDPFVELTPLLVATHDPMIHPGKGVMGIRLNGVDEVEMQDVEVSNIHSSTGLGTLLAGAYTNAVSQQAPYMNGFSMNMVNGLSMTFSTAVVLNNVQVHHIVSNTGLAYGVAAWYQTEVQVYGKKGLSIHHVHAGRELQKSSRFKSDSFPNLRPEACAFRVYDDVVHRTVVKYDVNAGNENNLDIACISGHTGCLFKENDWTSVGVVSPCDDATVDLDADVDVKEVRTSVSTPVMVVTILVVVAAMAVCIGLRSTSKANTLPSFAESTPLLGE